MSAPKIRDDLRLVPLARWLGYQIEIHEQDKHRGKSADYTERANCPHFPLSFQKGGKHIWFCSKGWACADLIGDGARVAINYVNHRYERDLEVALRKES